MYIIFQCDNTLERGMHLLKEEEEEIQKYVVGLHRSFGKGMHIMFIFVII